MRRWRVRVEWRPQYACVGAFWDRRTWFGGTTVALDAAAAKDQQLAHHSLDVWVCLLPMVPIHVERLSCPEPRECQAYSCWVREVGKITVRPVTVPGDTEPCRTCRGRGWVHDISMGPPHPDDCAAWCSAPCPTCSPEGGTREVGPESYAREKRTGNLRELLEEEGGHAPPSWVRFWGNDP